MSNDDDDDAPTDPTQGTVVNGVCIACKNYGQVNNGSQWYPCPNPHCPVS